MMMTGHSVAPLLIASAAGYWVMTQAEHQKGGVRKLGQYLGLAIVVASIIGAACKIYCAAACATSSACPTPMMMKGSACPMSKTMGMPSSSAPPESR